jgi:hypothetical protein
MPAVPFRSDEAIILLEDSRTTTNPADDGFSTPNTIASGFSSTFSVSNLLVGGSGFDAFGPETISTTTIDSASLGQARGLAVPSTGDVNEALYDGPEYWQVTLTNESAAGSWSVDSFELTRVNDAVSGDVRLAVYYSVDGHASETLLLGPTTGNSDVGLSVTNLRGYSDLQNLGVGDTVSFRIYTYQDPGDFWDAQANRRIGLDGLVVKMRSDVRMEEIDDYTMWSGLYPAADLSDPAADYDGDGLSNDAERLFGRDPTSGASRRVIMTMLDPGTDSFSYTRRDPAFHSSSYTIWTSTDLVTWTEDTGAQQIVDSTVNNVQEVTVVVSASPVDGRLFVQVRAE